MNTSAPGKGIAGGEDDDEQSCKKNHMELL
jgi:hypothetical protein